MKNILFLEQFSQISGGQKVLLSILQGLDRGNYRPFVAVPKKGELTDELDKMKIDHFIFPIGNYSSGRKNLFDILSYLFRSCILVSLSFWVIKREKIDLVYANAPRTFVWATMAANLAGVPVIWHLHSLISGLEFRLCRLVYGRGVTKLLAVSRFVAEPFTLAFPDQTSKVEVIYNGVDLEKYPLTNNGSSFRSGLKIQEDQRLVGYIGQIAEWKGVADLIRAASIVLKNEPRSVFVLVGETLFDEKKKQRFKRRLAELVDEYGIREKVMFTGKRTDIPLVLAAFQVLILPSLEPDPCPLVLLEAMAAGKAIVASAHGGPLEIIEDGKDGLLFPPGDYQRLALAISRLLHDTELAKRLGKQARLKAEQNFSLDRYQQEINAKIGRVLNV